MTLRVSSNCLCVIERLVNVCLSFISNNHIQFQDTLLFCCHSLYQRWRPLLFFAGHGFRRIVTYLPCQNADFGSASCLHISQQQHNPSERAMCFCWSTCVLHTVDIAQTRGIMHQHALLRLP